MQLIRVREKNACIWSSENDSNNNHHDNDSGGVRKRWWYIHIAQIIEWEPCCSVHIKLKEAQHENDDGA